MVDADQSSGLGATEWPAKLRAEDDGDYIEVAGDDTSDGALQPISGLSQEAM